MQITPNFSADLYKQLSNAFNNGVAEYKEVFQSLHQTIPSKAAINQYWWQSVLPFFEEVDRYQAAKIRNAEVKSFDVPNKKFEAAIEISEDDIEDDQLGVHAITAKSMGQAGMQIVDELFAKSLSNGFSTTNTYDGLTLFNSAHTLGESTINNTGTATLTETSLLSAITTILKYKVKPDKLSTARPLNPTAADGLTLVVPVELKHTAEELVLYDRNSDNAGRPKTFGKVKEVIASSWLDSYSTTAWYLMVNNGLMKPFILQDRTPLTLKNFTPNNESSLALQGNYLFMGKRRCNLAPTHPFLFWGSNGTTS